MAPGVSNQCRHMGVMDRSRLTVTPNVFVKDVLWHDNCWGEYQRPVWVFGN